jgi:hypothetical protein
MELRELHGGLRYGNASKIEEIPLKKRFLSLQG